MTESDERLLDGVLQYYNYPAPPPEKGKEGRVMLAVQHLEGLLESARLCRDRARLVETFKRTLAALTPFLASEQVDSAPAQAEDMPWTAA